MEFQGVLGGEEGPEERRNFFQAPLAVDENSLCRANWEEGTCMQVFHMFKLRNNKINLSLVPV